MVADGDSTTTAKTDHNGDSAECSSPQEQQQQQDASLETQVQGMRSELSYLTHQVYRILLALHVPPCTCANCTSQHQAQNELILNSTQQQLGHTQQDMSSDSGHSHAENEPLPVKPHVEEHSSMVSPGACLSLAPPGDFKLAMPPLGVGAEPQPFTANRVPGRRSKYVTQADKEMVANYAAKHGATAAAKHFGIPPSVAAYYHRKVYNRHLPKGRRPSLPAAFDMSAIEASTSRPMVRCVPATGAVSNGVRGRGRPKKIGDELDAQFIDHLCDLLMEGQALTGESVLHLARVFISKNSPGLLDTEGGTVTLTSGWAGKELQRAHETLRSRRMRSQHAVESIAQERYADCATLLGAGNTSVAAVDTTFDEAMTGVVGGSFEDAPDANAAAQHESLGVFGAPALMLNESA